jgi:hypothetical protein
LRLVEGHHGHEIADTVLPVIKLFEIEGNLGAFQMDNATNNDIALKVITASIPSISTKCKERQMESVIIVVKQVVRLVI